MGVPGAFSERQLGEGLCPLLGVDNVYCQGSSCAPLSAECFPGIVELVMSRYWILFLTLAIVLVFMLLYLSIEHRRYPEKVQYPYDKVICSVLPAFGMILCTGHINAFFYGTNYNVDDLTIDVPLIAQFLPTADGSYLAVVGVVYGLLIAQIIAIVHEKFVSIRNALSEELASCQQVSVLIKSISTKGRCIHYVKYIFLDDCPFNYMMIMHNILTINGIDTWFTLLFLC